MTIFKKSLLTLGIATLGFSAVLFISVMVFMNSLYYEVNIQGLGNTAKTLMKTIGEDRIARVFEDSRDFEADDNYFPINENDPYRLTLIAPSGYVNWDSHIKERLVNHINRVEIIKALEGSEGVSHRESVSTNIHRLYYAIPVYNNDNDIIGVFRLSISIPGFAARVSPIILSFIIFIILFLITAFWAIYMFSRSLSSSLFRLVNIAQAGTSLVTSQQDIEPASSEFLSLEKAMRAMTAELNLRFEQAKAEGNRLEAILNGMSEAVFAVDSSLNLRMVNPNAREMFNIGNINEKNISLLEATRSIDLVDIANNAINSGSVIERELTFHSSIASSAVNIPDNEKVRRARQFQIYASPLSGEKTAKNSNSNDECSAVIVMKDITRLVKLERVRKDFVANVSHELRTPIQLVKGFSETLLDSEISKGNKKQITHYIEIINKNACIMENLTNDLLILANIENNDYENDSNKIYDMENHKVLSLIEEAVSALKFQAEKKQIEINVNCPDDLNATLQGLLITQALINLIDNGIKYSQSKSKLWISAKNSESEDSSGKKNELIIEVRDKGIGIPAEHLERIFERFYRVDRSRSKEAGGTGLGLSIVRHIALLHNGKAEAESHAGEGSVLRIRIPQ